MRLTYNHWDRVTVSATVPKPSGVTHICFFFLFSYTTTINIGE